MVLGTEDIASSDDSFLSWIDERSPENTLDALNEFETYINEAGPFDGLIAFSQAAGFAASFIIRTLREREPVDTLVAPPFRCAIFFCAAPLEGESAFGKYLDPVVDKHRIAMPTAHIWGKNDRQVQKSGSWLVELCVKDGTEVFIHEEGHEIPGTRKPEALRGALRAIRKTIEKATFAC